MDSILFKDSSHRIVASDLTPIVGVLEFIRSDILPDLFYRLRPGKLFRELNKNRLADQSR